MNTENTLKFLERKRQEGFKYIVQNKDKEYMVFPSIPRKLIKSGKWCKTHKDDKGDGVYLNKEILDEMGISFLNVTWYVKKPTRIDELEKEINNLFKRTEENICDVEKEKTETDKKVLLEDNSIPQTLEETVPYMLSDNYKKRFVGEYWQTKIRYEKLHNMVIKMIAGTLDFTPICSLEDFEKQLGYMGNYLKLLEIRAEKEHIKLR